MFLPQCQRPSFTSIQNNRQNYSYWNVDINWNLEIRIVTVPKSACGLIWALKFGRYKAGWVTLHFQFNRQFLHFQNWKLGFRLNSSYCFSLFGGTGCSSLLRHCNASRKVAGSIPDGVIGIFHWHNPSGRTMALGSTQPLTEMSTSNIYWGDKGGRCVGLTTLPLSYADCLEIWEPQPAGTLRVCPGL